MAGAYPDVPGHRMAYDRDGSIGFTMANGVVTQKSSSDLQLTNREASGNAGLSVGQAAFTMYYGVLFPEPRDIQGLAWQANPNDSSTIQTSTNTTNGLDGTWTDRGTVGRLNHTAANGSSNVAYLPGIRSNIASVSYSGIKGIRLALGTNYHKWVQVLHIYGSPSTGEAPDRLRIWHPTLAQEIGGAYFDWGDVARSTSADRDFRIYNPSALTAQGVTLTSEALTDSSPSLPGQHTFSYDGGAFASSVNIGDIAPGGVSGVMTLRRNISSGAALGLWTFRIVAAAASYA